MARDEVEEYLREQDNFDLFVADRLKKDPNAKTSVADITVEFNVWADGVGVGRLAVSVVGKKLRRLGFEGGFKRAPGSPITQRIVHAKILTGQRRGL